MAPAKILATTTPVLPELSKKDRVIIDAGTRAPFSGVLITREALSKLLSDHNAEVETLSADLERLDKMSSSIVDNQKQICDARVSAEQAKLKLCNDTRKSEEIVYGKAVDRLSDQSQRRWWESPHLWTVVGFGVCAAAVGVGYGVSN